MYHTHTDSQDVISASRITDIVGGSSLTDEEIQRLIELLLEKSNANAEWEGVSEPCYARVAVCGRHC